MNPKYSRLHGSAMSRTALYRDIPLALLGPMSWQVGLDLLK